MKSLMKIKLIICCVCSIAFIISCSKVRFVIQENNWLLKNACESGRRTYRGYSYRSRTDQNTGKKIKTCKINKNFLKLDKIVENKLFNKADCIFEVDYYYFNKLQDYVKAKRPRQLKNMLIITERKFLDTLYYFDSLNYAKDPW